MKKGLYVLCDNALHGSDLMEKTAMSLIFIQQMAFFQ